MKTHLFIGPTGASLPSGALVRLHRHPPVEAGSIAALMGEPPGEIVMVDGNLEPGREIPAAEIVAALRACWRVWGLASVGALKAAELQREGVRGFGFIARYARLFPKAAENEVAALYFPTPPYAPASEPLIELRLLLRALRKRGKLCREEEGEIARFLSQAPLEDRTFGFVARRFPAAAEIPPEEWQAKRRDLRAFLAHYFCA